MHIAFAFNSFTNSFVVLWLFGSHFPKRFGCGNSGVVCENTNRGDRGECTGGWRLAGNAANARLMAALCLVETWIERATTYFANIYLITKNVQRRPQTMLHQMGSNVRCQTNGKNQDKQFWIWVFFFSRVVVS